MFAGKLQDRKKAIVLGQAYVNVSALAVQPRSQSVLVASRLGSDRSLRVQALACFVRALAPATAADGRAAQVLPGKGASRRSGLKMRVAVKSATSGRTRVAAWENSELVQQSDPIVAGTTLPKANEDGGNWGERGFLPPCCLATDGDLSSTASSPSPCETRSARRTSLACPSG